MKIRNKKQVVNGVGLCLSACLIFYFFFQKLPYHLFHREQTQLFLFASDPIKEYFSHPGALANLTGDFLTQFFYYEGAGPVLLALLLIGWGVVVFRLFFPYIRFWAWIPAGFAVVWETGRECGLYYPLAGTIALIGIGGTLLLCRFWIKRSWKTGIPASVLTILIGYGLFGSGVWPAKWYNLPDFDREYLLAIDSEMYFGRWQKARDLLAKEQLKNPVVTYYYNLLNAQEQKLPDKLLAYYQPASQGLFLPVAPGSNYHTIYAANEVWFALGDMTMAEHATILGMIFSPRHTGARAMKRLAEINLINGDDAAAMKYLRLLQKTTCYRTWAEQRIPGKQTPEVHRWLEQKRLLLPTTDTLRVAANVQLSLRHLLRNNPENKMARDYLYCLHLLNKDIPSFIKDYKEFGDTPIPSRLYAEGLLIYLAGSRATPEEVLKWRIPSSILVEFNSYTRLYEANQGNGVPLQAQYGKTYWFYYHYAMMKK